MFEVKLNLGQLTYAKYADLPGIEAFVQPTSNHAGMIREALSQQGYVDSIVLLRGGFRSKEDFDLLVKKGTDYHGRPRISRYFAHHTRDSPNGIFVSPIDDIGSGYVGIDPLFHALREWNNVHALAVYDAVQFEVVRRDLREYNFRDPRKKLQALLGVIHFEFTS